jgi:acyl dehydratase
MLQQVRTLTQADLDAFASLSGDANPIHIDPAFAARSTFGRTVAHGAMLTAILRALAAPMITDRAVIQLAAMFPAPTFADEPIQFTAEALSTSQILLRSVRLSDSAETCRIVVDLT